MTHQQYIEAITRPPLESMIRQNKDGFKYIPISVIQAELLLIYEGFYKWEMLKDVVTKEGLWGMGKLWYRVPTWNQNHHILSPEWMFQTGTASIPIIKRLRLSYPSLESHCLMNAAKKIGPWFGQTLNRDEDDAPLEEGVPVIQVANERIEVQIEKAMTLDELGGIKKEATATPELRTLFMKRVRQLTP